MPNGIYVPGPPVANDIRGFDKPYELYCVVGRDNEPMYFGYKGACEFFAEAKALVHGHYDIKPLNPKTGKPYDYLNCTTLV
jgi:hypothetical protein